MPSRYGPREYTSALTPHAVVMARVARRLGLDVSTVPMELPVLTDDGGWLEKATWVRDNYLDAMEPLIESLRRHPRSVVARGNLATFELGLARARRLPPCLWWERVAELGVWEISHALAGTPDPGVHGVPAVPTLPDADPPVSREEAR